MPFEAPGQNPRRRIAIIGGGISGLGAAWRLAGAHEVVLFEAEPRLGGHARTLMAGGNGDQPVDTGFIVFNRVNYPHLCALFSELDVPVAESDMSFGASLRGGAFEFGLRDLKALFSQKRNALSPRFWGMIRDITRFNANALAEATNPDETLGDFLQRLGMGDWFIRYYLLPLSGAIWSTPTGKVLEFPAQALIRFFENHALLHHSGQHQWYTVQGGSIEYVTRLTAALQRAGVSLRRTTPVEAVRRGSEGVSIRAKGAWESYDDVIFASHSDVALSLLEDPTPAEQAALGAIRYQPNRVVLHSDASVMPKRRGVWSSWNYSETPQKEMNQIDLTYWMNCLQPIPNSDPLFVTLNCDRSIDPALIHDETTLRHPVFDLGALQAQGEIAALNGQNNSWFCGAWRANGFHEDGLASAYEVADALIARHGRAPMEQVA
ncbi:MAG: FAD-dependent oxidoreductase [Pelagimonas sp.]|jgi:predicted NAD/FAD-binding protein|nr:FAD-dependent oxidoreductase [Pelagimonas sp.]